MSTVSDDDAVPTVAYLDAGHDSPLQMPRNRIAGRVCGEPKKEGSRNSIRKPYFFKENLEYRRWDLNPHEVAQLDLAADV